MSRTLRHAALLAAGLCIGFAATAAAQPRLQNGTVRARPAARLEPDFRALVATVTTPAWVGYAVPLVAGEHRMCCGTYQGDTDHACCGTCRLESPERSMTVGAAPKAVALEPPDELFVLYRVEQRRVGKIRTFTADCELDAGGLTLHWLTGVDPAQSVALLQAHVTGTDPDGASGRWRRTGVSAIAFHADAAADRALETFVARSQPETLRKDAAFWLGNARGRRGFEVLRRLVQESDDADGLRRHLVFALTQSREPDAMDLVIRIARTDASPRMRGEALFWLSQKKDPRAGPTIVEAIDSDPSPEVRKKAVFALGQLGEAGEPLLVQIARGHTDPAVRGEAIFWLAQRAGRKAAQAITAAVDQDPDTEVKKRAVFALSQLPKDEGVPLLIQVARTNRNPAVRKQAIFWLGQSRDPRALAFFEEVLK
jgi:HEAT repeat protein